MKKFDYFFKGVWLRIDIIIRMVNNRGGGKGILKDWLKFGIFFVVCGIYILVKYKKILVNYFWF